MWCGLGVMHQLIAFRVGVLTGSLNLTSRVKGGAEVQSLTVGCSFTDGVFGSIPAYAPALQAHERASTGAGGGKNKPQSQRSPHLQEHGTLTSSIYAGLDGALRNLAEYLPRSPNFVDLIAPCALTRLRGKD